MDTCTPWTHLPVLLKGQYRSFLCIAWYKNSFHLKFIFYIGSVQGVLSVQNIYKNEFLKEKNFNAILFLFQAFVSLL